MSIMECTDEVIRIPRYVHLLILMGHRCCVLTVRAKDLATFIGDGNGLFESRDNEPPVGA